MAKVDEPDETDAQVYDDNGVDRSLVRHMLDLTPAERVRTHDEHLAGVEFFLAAGEAARRGRT